MKKRLDDVIEMLDIGELVMMKKDIDSGGQKIGKLVEAKIRQQIKKHDRFCCVCNSRLDPYSVSNFTLMFGPEDMKKRASFCAIDCMEHFMANLKEFWGEDNQVFIKNIDKKRR